MNDFLKAFDGVVGAGVVGSWLNNLHTEQSDVDLLLVCDPRNAPRKPYKAVSSALDVTKVSVTTFVDLVSQKAAVDFVQVILSDTFLWDKTSPWYWYVQSVTFNHLLYQKNLLALAYNARREAARRIDIRRTKLSKAVRFEMLYERCLDNNYSPEFTDSERAELLDRLEYEMSRYE